MTRSLPAALLAPASLLVALAAPLAPTVVPATPGEVRVPRDLARETSPPPFARTCVVSFDQLAPVDASCPTLVYSERWDGPVLLASNHSTRTTWVSYIYADLDGRLYHGPCYELPAGSTRAISDQSMRPLAAREVHVTITPGPGFPSGGFQIGCRPQRQALAGR